MDIIKTIEQTEDFSYSISFDYALQCGKLLTGSDSARAIVRNAAIHILDKWDSIPKETYPIWGDIIEAVGFYPYLDKNASTIVLDAFSDEVRKKSFLSEYLPNIYMHSEQKKLSNYLRSDKNIVASAPISFGKSLLIEESVASQKYRNIVIIQPTLALLDETRLKLKKYGSIYKIIVRTSQEPSIDKGNLFLLTGERVMEYVNLPKIDLFIIDEFYKMSLRRVNERADTLNNAFLKIYNTFHPKFYLLGPNIDKITDGFAEKYNAIFFKANYSLVDCDVIPVETKGLKKSAMAEKLFSLLDEQSAQQTLVYCSAPARVRKLARDYLNHLKNSGASANTSLPIIDWLNATIPKWSLIEELSYGIAIHDGSLPKHLGISIIRYFNDNKIRCIFCTSTIIEGVNTSAKNVIIFGGKKGLKDVDYFDYSNIKGRSGRLMEHYLGKVYCFIRIPDAKSVVVDIPFFEQDADVLSPEILVNIQDKDVQQQVRQLYIKLNSTEPELLKILKANCTKINGQMAIYNKLCIDLTTQRSNIVWTYMPTYDQMLYVLQICKNNCFDFTDSRGVRSIAQLVFLLNKYRTSGNFGSIIQDIYEHSIQRLKKQTEQKKVVDSLQRYVCEKNSLQPGSYSYFVQQLENDFIRNDLSILVEYGIPSETVRKIEPHIPENLNEDGVMKYTNENKDKLLAPLMQYERDRIEQCL